MPMNRANLALTVASSLILAAGVMINSSASWRAIVRPKLLEAWKHRSLADWHRAAYIAEGEEFAEFIAFIHKEAPADSRIVLPPHNIPRPQAHVGLMQYYLFPREVINCGVNEVEACVSRIGAATTYILAIPEFPPRDLAEVRLDYVEFRDGFGVFVPDESLHP